jgi:hypothetical protein
MLDQDVQNEEQERIKRWREIREEVENSDEELPDDFPLPLQFRSPEDLDL